MSHGLRVLLFALASLTFALVSSWMVSLGHKEQFWRTAGLASVLVLLGLGFFDSLYPVLAIALVVGGLLVRGSEEDLTARPPVLAEGRHLNDVLRVQYRLTLRLIEADESVRGQLAPLVESTCNVALDAVDEAMDRYDTEAQLRILLQRRRVAEAERRLFDLQKEREENRQRAIDSAQAPVKYGEMRGSYGGEYDSPSRAERKAADYVFELEEQLNHLIATEAENARIVREERCPKCRAAASQNALVASNSSTGRKPVDPDTLVSFPVPGFDHPAPTEFDAIEQEPMVVTDIRWAWRVACAIFCGAVAWFRFEQGVFLTLICAALGMVIGGMMHWLTMVNYAAAAILDDLRAFRIKSIFGSLAVGALIYGMGAWYGHLVVVGDGRFKLPGLVIGSARKDQTRANPARPNASVAVQSARQSCGRCSYDEGCKLTRVDSPTLPCCEPRLSLFGQNHVAKCRAQNP